MNGTAEVQDLSPRTILSLIDPRLLERECFVRCIELARPEIAISGFASAGEWKVRAGEIEEPQVVLYNTGNRPVATVAAEIVEAVTLAEPCPLVVIGAVNELAEMLAAFDCGARGYLPASVGIDEIVETSRLASFSGIFLPLASLDALRDAHRELEPAIAMDESLTERQRAVCDALRRGKSNKVIASELNLCESTVKVHIRNIMKKLGASNRTEAAFKLNSGVAADEARTG